MRFVYWILVCVGLGILFGLLVYLQMRPSDYLFGSGLVNALAFGGMTFGSCCIGLLVGSLSEVKV